MSKSFSLDKWGWINYVLGTGVFASAAYLGVRNALYTYESMRDAMSPLEAIGTSAFINFSESIIVGILFSPPALEIFVSKVASAAGVSSRAAHWMSRFLLVVCVAAITVIDFSSTWGQLDFVDWQRRLMVTCLYVFGTEVGFIIASIAWSMAKSSDDGFSPRTRRAPSAGAAQGSRVEDFINM